MGDWDQFVQEVSWFVEAGADVTVDTAISWSRPPIGELAVMSALLASSTVTPVSINGKAFELLTWGPRHERRGWLCMPPNDDGAVEVHPVHRKLLAVCGGIVERFGEPASRWLNQNEVLTVSAAVTSVADVLTAYAWLWQDDGREIPIDPADYYVAAIEADGNLTLIHRETGRLVLFAPDHSFTDVTPLPDCPDYSLMTIDEVPDLVTWIEQCAERWTKT